MSCNLKAYSKKSDAELQYIINDAREAANAMNSLGNYESECKYLDQINDASTVLYQRRQSQKLAA